MKDTFSGDEDATFVDLSDPEVSAAVCGTMLVRFLGEVAREGRVSPGWLRTLVALRLVHRGSTPARLTRAGQMALVAYREVVPVRTAG